jgi:hypothetical protein
MSWRKVRVMKSDLRNEETAFGFRGKGRMSDRLEELQIEGFLTTLTLEIS